MNKKGRKEKDLKVKKPQILDENIFEDSAVACTKNGGPCTTCTVPGPGFSS
jgi:hypothetical protein